MKLMSSAVSAAIVLCASVAAAPTLGHGIVLELDPARTTVKFRLADVLHTVEGTFKLRRGTIRFDRQPEAPRAKR